jgi:Fe-S-cluster-containing dehydrogenase component
MMNKCPGQTTPRNLDSVLVPCPACGRVVEFFTDEAKRRCRCGRLLLRELLPRCAEWCPAAAVCLGEAIDVRELQRRLARIKNDPRAKRCLESIRQRLRRKSSGGQPA